MKKFSSTNTYVTTDFVISELTAYVWCTRRVLNTNISHISKPKMLHQSRCGKLATLCILIVLDFSYFIMQKICIAVHIRYIEVFSKFTALSWFRKKK